MNAWTRCRKVSFVLYFFKKFPIDSMFFIMNGIAIVPVIMLVFIAFVLSLNVYVASSKTRSVNAKPFGFTSGINPAKNANKKRVVLFFVF